MAVIGAKNIATTTMHVPSISRPSTNSRMHIAMKAMAMMPAVIPLTPSGTATRSAKMVNTNGRARFPNGGGPAGRSISRGGAYRLRLIA